MNHRVILKAMGFARECAGKGTTGCLIFVLLFGCAMLAGARVIPVYYSFSSFETDVKTEISQAGARFYDDETVIKHVLDIAKRNEIRLQREDITVEHIASQLQISIHYSVPVDLMVYEHNMDFKIRASSYVGTL
jgi:hypothetical protein